MQTTYDVINENPIQQSTECLVLVVYAGSDLSGPARQLDKLSGGHLTRALGRTAMRGKRGEALLLLDVPSSSAERVLLIGCGRRNRVNARLFCRVADFAAAELARSGAKNAVSCLSLVKVKNRDSRWKVRQLVQSNTLHHYRFDQLKSESRRNKPVERIQKIYWAVSSARKVDRFKPALMQAQAIAEGMKLARDLGNLPGNVCTPGYLADQARALADKHAHVTTHVLEEAEMETLGMGALLCVSRGSDQPAKLIVVDYRGGEEDAKPVVLVGKGVTFDSGGLSIKPAEPMERMKFDMGGAASVLGTLDTCATLQLPINCIGVIAAVENLIGGSAVKPGDVVTSMSGRTIEVLNTDAEGRLALCDALSYAKRFKPAVIIDIATLTGACVVALGPHAHGLFSNSDSLSKRLVSAGRRAHDRPWPMPLWDEYQPMLDSQVADMANVGGGGAGGAITAACFLARFVRDQRWAHLDIAGTATQGGSARSATGRPVPLLTQYLIDRAGIVKEHEPAT